jgi:hypothetical protein
VGQDGCAGRIVSVCLVAVAMSTAFEAVEIAVRYLTEAERLPTPLTSGSITGHTLRSLLYFSLFGM